MGREQRGVVRPNPSTLGCAAVVGKGTVGVQPASVDLAESALLCETDVVAALGERGAKGHRSRVLLRCGAVYQSESVEPCFLAELGQVVGPRILVLLVV